MHAKLKFLNVAEELSDCVASEFAIKNPLMHTLGSPLVVSGILPSRLSSGVVGAFYLCCCLRWSFHCVV